MCTAFTLQSLQMENFFCRTMDFSYDIEPGFFIVPRNNLWYNPITMKKHNDCYSFIGIGQKTDSMLGFFDGVNEKGFAAAALYFAGYAYYDIPVEDKNKEPIASLDFLHYILGRCTSVDELDMILKSICVLGLPDPVTKIAAPLHWIATDKSGKCVVIEQTQNGLEIFDNPIGVMTNSPSYSWHCLNLLNYFNIRNLDYETLDINGEKLNKCFTGDGAMGLPGDCSSTSRFIRLSFLKKYAVKGIDEEEGVSNIIHLFNNVAVPLGLVELSEKNNTIVYDECLERYEYTIYTAVMCAESLRFYWVTYENQRVQCIDLNDLLDVDDYVEYDLNREPDFKYITKE